MSAIFLNLLSFFSVLGRTIARAAGKLFNLLWDTLRYNSLVLRIVKTVCIAFIIGAAAFLVYFAITSPELPPENLISTIRNVAVNHQTQGYYRPQVVLSGDEDYWVELTSFDGSEFEKGAGYEIQDRSVDFEYPIRPGETLSEIAYTYGISYNFLAWYNKISNANRIRVGTVIIIPSLENIDLYQAQYQQQEEARQQSQALIPAKAAKNIKISNEGRDNGVDGLTVQFFIIDPPSNLKSYERDLGDGKRSFRENPSYEYSSPGTYVIRLTAKDDTNVIYSSNQLYIHIPHPSSSVEHSTIRFVTLSSPDDYFVVNGTIVKVERYGDMKSVLDLSESDKFLTKVQFKKSGYYGITVQEESGREQYYSIFVSPIPTRHVDSEVSNFNWYRTQFNTGTPSNCGPASTSMAISWNTGRYFPVSAVRQAIGWQGDGGTSFDELLGVIKSQGADASIRPLRTAQNIFDVIDSGGIAIILFHTDGVTTSRNNPASDLFGKYYNDSVGHYVVVKGYSMDGEYLVIHDPIPSDWSANSFRYEDEISMIGRNRYFRASEVLRSLRRGDMIVVPGPG